MIQVRNARMKRRHNLHDEICASGVAKKAITRFPSSFINTSHTHATSYLTIPILKSLLHLFLSFFLHSFPISPLIITFFGIIDMEKRI